MPLNPQIELLLKNIKESGGKPFEAMTPTECRVAVQGFKALGGLPEPVASVEHDFVPGPSADLPIRVYRPLSPGYGPFAALVYFHGGGWIAANIEVSDTLSRSLANRTGCVVIAVNYQKSPEHRFPVPMDDCFAATRWVFEHTDLLDIDAERIGVIGDSAGANLAAAVALRARDEGAPNLACQVLICPVVQYGWDTPSYLRHAEGYLIHRATMAYFWDHYVNSPSDGTHPYCSPLAAADHSDLPRTFIVSAEFDPVCDDGRMYAEKLEAANVDVKYRMYDGAVHGFLWMAGIVDQSKVLINDIAEEVKRMMG